MARPVDASAYVDSPAEEGDDGVVHRVVRAVMVAVLVAAVVLTDLGPMVFAGGAVAGAIGTVRTRRGGTGWWTVLMVALWVLTVPLFLLLTSVADGLTPGALTLQMVAGALLGAVIAALVEPVSRMVRRRRGAPTAV